MRLFRTHISCGSDCIRGEAKPTVSDNLGDVKKVLKKGTHVWLDEAVPCRVDGRTIKGKLERAQRGRRVDIVIEVVGEGGPRHFEQTGVQIGYGGVAAEDNQSRITEAIGQEPQDPKCSSSGKRRLRRRPVGMVTLRPTTPPPTRGRNAWYDELLGRDG